MPILCYYFPMYECIYFDLDDTLVRDNPDTGESELLKSGLDVYEKMSKEYPSVPKILFTNRRKEEIKYPKNYSFNEVIGREDMEEYIIKNINKVRFSTLLSLRNLYLFIRGYVLFKNKSTPKLLYVFLKHLNNGERILVFDDDRRVSGMFSK